MRRKAHQHHVNCLPLPGQDTCYNHAQQPTLQSLLRALNSATTVPASAVSCKRLGRRPCRDDRCKARHLLLYALAAASTSCCRHRFLQAQIAAKRPIYSCMKSPWGAPLPLKLPPAAAAAAACCACLLTLMPLLRVLKVPRGTALSTTSMLIFLLSRATLL